MISVDVTTALFLYLALVLTFLFGTWLLTCRREQKQRSLPPPLELFTCEFCHHSYLKETLLKVSKCPSCSLFNREET